MCVIYEHETIINEHILINYCIYWLTALLQLIYF
jgi:hypothetical protein